MDLTNIVCTVLSVISTFGSTVALINSIYVQQRLAKRQTTIEAFNILQNEVLDILVFDKFGNAEIIVENTYNSKCEEAYKAYKTLVARLEHFAVGVNQKVYDFKVVNKLAGIHLIYLYEKIKPVIDNANKYSHEILYYGEFVKLIDRLKKQKNNKQMGEIEK